MELLCILRPAHTKGAPIDDFMAPGQAFCTIQFAREKKTTFLRPKIALWGKCITIRVRNSLFGFQCESLIFGEWKCDLLFSIIIIIIMDPPRVFIVFCAHLLHDYYRYRYIGRWFSQLCTGRDSIAWSWWMCRVFPHISVYHRFGAICFPPSPPAGTCWQVV